jgi:tetratricopeptide (TPR) repeat protein
MPDDQRLTLNLAGGHWSLAGTLWGRKHLSDAALHYERARLLQEEVLRALPADRPARRQLAYTYESLGTLWSRTGDARAVGSLRRALELRREMAQSDPRDADARLNAIDTQKNLAMALALFGSTAEALRDSDGAVALAEAELAAHPQDVRVRVLAAEAYGARSSVEQQTPTAPTPAVRRLRLEREHAWLAKAIALYRDLDKEGSLSAPARHTMQQVTERAEECAQALEKMGASD